MLPVRAVAVLLPVLFAASSPAQSTALAAPRVVGPGPVAEGEVAAAPADERRARRLLTLVDGRVIRAETRRVDGRWERKGDAGWQALPAGLVASAVDERDVLSEMRKRDKQLRRATPGERVPYARWMLDSGLYSEGLMELHEILVAAPDDSAARALLARDDLPVAVPAWEALDPDQVGARGRLREYGSRSPLPLQELVIRELDGIDAPSEREALRAELLSDLQSRHAGRRGFATLALRRLFPGDGAPLLVERALYDAVTDVRRGAALAVRDADSTEGVLELASALMDDHAGVRTHAADALGIVAHPATAAALMTALPRAVAAASGSTVASGPRGHVFVGKQRAYVADYEPEVATNAVIANPEIGVVQEGAVLDVRVLGAGGYGYGASTEVSAIRSALGRVTGADVHDTNSAWSRWWKNNGEEWLGQHGDLAALSADTSVDAGG